MTTSFTVDPDDVSRRNGQFLGFPYTLEQANMVFFPVPWDVTTSYGEGTARGPQTIIDASIQLEPTDSYVAKAWEIGHYTVPVNPEIQAKNDQTREIAKRIIEYQEAGGSDQDSAIQTDLDLVNQESEYLNQWVYQETSSLLKQQKLVGLMGGDHSVPLGYIKALIDHYGEYGILQIDAHADLRNAYEGFRYSHASIMHNVMQSPEISHLIQVGVRDYSQGELEQANQDQRIQWFTDWQLKENLYAGYCWFTQCQEIIATLPQQVYISFDIDGLNPYLCPNTGTPVPGGLDFNQAIYLIEKVVQSGKQIIGFDLCEVSPDLDNPHHEWDGNVGARIAYKLANLMFASQANN